MLDEGFPPGSISSSENGLVYVAEHKRGWIKVRIYNVNTGEKEVWNTFIYSTTQNVQISLNADFVVISTGDVTYVYNMDRVLQYKVAHHQLCCDGFKQTYVTDKGMFWGAHFMGRIIMNLKDKTSHNITNFGTFGVSGTSNGYVYVTRFDEIDEYSQDGTLYYCIPIGQPKGKWDIYQSAAIRISDHEALIAFRTWNDTLPIAIFSVHQ